LRTRGGFPAAHFLHFANVRQNGAEFAKHWQIRKVGRAVPGEPFAKHWQNRMKFAEHWQNGSGAKPEHCRRQELRKAKRLRRPNIGKTLNARGEWNFFRTFWRGAAFNC
jgi:hypothetical protein